MKDKFRKMMDDRSAADKMKADYAQRREKSEKNLNAYTVVLSVVSVIIAILFFVYRDLWFGLGFLGLAAVLGLVAFLSYRAEHKSREKSPQKKDCSSSNNNTDMDTE